MDIKVNALSELEELLLRFTQILAPMKGGEEGGGCPSFAGKVFVPPEPLREDARFPYPVRPLREIYQATAKIGQWIQTIVEEEKEPSGEKTLKSPVSRGERFLPPSPLPTDRKGLIVQVRQAIQSLAMALEDPKSSRVREVAKKLKPFIDELIEVVAQDGMETQDGSKSPVRNPPSTAPKQQKSGTIPFPFPKAKEPPLKTKTFSFTVPASREEKAPRAPAPKRGGEEMPVFYQKLTIDRPPGQSRTNLKETTSANPHPATPLFTSQTITPVYSLLSQPHFREKQPLLEEQEVSPSQPHLDRISLPIAPPLPQALRQRAKKKKKNFWGREEKQEEEERTY